MPGFRGLRARRVIQAFEKAGGVTRAGKGDHMNIKMPNGQIVTIPGRGDVKLGLLEAATQKGWAR